MMNGFQSRNLDKSVKISHTRSGDALISISVWNCFKDGLSLGPDLLFKGILDSTDEAKLLNAASRLGSRTPKAGILFWFKEANCQTFLAGLSNLFKYGRIGECEIKTSPSQHVVVVRHELGLRWSKFLQNYLDAAAASVLSIKPAFEVTPSMVSMKMPRAEPMSNPDESTPGS